MEAVAMHLTQPGSLLFMSNEKIINLDPARFSVLSIRSKVSNIVINFAKFIVPMRYIEWSAVPAIVLVGCPFPISSHSN